MIVEFGWKGQPNPQTIASASKPTTVMGTGESEPTRLQEAVKVSWADVLKFLRQLSHDLRNQLNAVELQSAFLAELATDAEVKEEIARLRKMVSQCGAALQKLSTRLNPPAANLMSYGAGELVEDLRTKIQAEFPKEADAVQWQLSVQNASVNTDPQLLQEALVELFRNAFEHRIPEASLRFIAQTEGDNLVLTLHEPKAEFQLPTDSWGREPLRYVNRGHYGLGLNRARTIVEGQGGSLQARYDSTESKLVTKVTLPLSNQQA